MKLPLLWGQFYCDIRENLIKKGIQKSHGKARKKNCLSHKQKLLDLSRNFPSVSFSAEKCSFSSVKQTEVFSVHDYFHWGNKKERCDSLDLWTLAWSPSGAAVEPGLPQGQGLWPWGRLIPLCPGDFGHHRAAAFRSGRVGGLQSWAACWDSQWPAWWGHFVLRPLLHGFLPVPFNDHARGVKWFNKAISSFSWPSNLEINNSQKNGSPGAPRRSHPMQKAESEEGILCLEVRVDVDVDVDVLWVGASIMLPWVMGHGFCVSAQSAWVSWNRNLTTEITIYLLYPFCLVDKLEILCHRMWFCSCCCSLNAPWQTEISWYS